MIKEFRKIATRQAPTMLADAMGLFAIFVLTFGVLSLPAVL